MIYVSTSCVKNKKIKDSVLELVKNGFSNIELSGGTDYYKGYLKDLIDLKEKYKLNYLCHNYFPPPKKNLVLNLASLNKEIYKKTTKHLKKSIELSSKLGAKKFGFHAGFYLDIKVEDLGKRIRRSDIYNIEESFNKFCIGFNKIQSYAKKFNIELYLENNVYSYENAKTYNNEKILMLTNSGAYKELSNFINFNLLLDVAHLKVSSNTENLNFNEELLNLVTKSNYIHISDNNGKHDSNLKISRKSELVNQLKKINLKNKDFTLEVYEDLDSIKESYNILNEIIHD